MEFASTVFRDFVTDGVPASGANKPQKSKIRAWGAYLEALQSGSGLLYAFSTATADADPGAGLFRLNNATPASATALYIDNLDAGGVSASAFIDTWDDSTNAVRGVLIIRGVDNPAVRVVYNVTGSIVDGSGYRKVTLVNISSSGALTASDNYVLTFGRSGDTDLSTQSFNQTTTGHFWADQGARIHKMNDRIMLGAATINDGNAVPTVKDWLETIRDSTTKNAQFAVLSAIGQAAVLGATRSSDFPGAASQGSIGVEGWAINDNASFVQSAFAGYFEARRSAGAGTTHGIEIDIVNAGSLVDIQPYGTYDYSSGITPGLWVASGGTAIGAVDATAGIAIINNGARFRKGIVFQSNSLLGTDGTGTGTANAIEMARAHKVRWMRANGNEAANIYSDITNTGPLQTIQFTDIGMLYRNTSAKNLLQVAAADNYVNGFVLTPTVTAGQPVLSVAGDDTNVSLGFATKGTGVFDIFTNGTVRQFQIGHVASAVNYLLAKGAATAGAVQLLAAGSDTNVGINLVTQGTGALSLQTNGGTEQVRVTHIASSVNYLDLRGAATAGNPTILASGTDAAISMVIQAKSTGSIYLSSGGNLAFEAQAPGSSVNRIVAQGAVTTGNPIIKASGSDTNITGALRGQGTGGWDLQDGGSASKFKYNTTGIGFFNATPVAKATVGAALSTGGAETNTNLATRINDLRTALINYGLAA